MHTIHENEGEARLTKKLQSERHQKRLEKITLGETIRKLRLRQRMKQSELAKKLGTTQSAIARMENGHQNFTVDLLQRIARVFGKKVVIKIV